jgi:hypothetical protein
MRALTCTERGDKMGIRYAVMALSFLSLLVPNPPNTASQDFKSSALTLHEMTQSTSDDRKGERTGNSVTYISANATKISSSDGTDILVLVGESSIVNVDHNDKTYSVRTFQQAEDIARKNGNLMSNTKVSIINVGRGESIAGYVTEKYHATMNYETNWYEQMDLWIAPRFGVPPQYYDNLNLVELGDPMMGRICEETKKIDGMVLKKVMIYKGMGKEIQTTTMVTSVERGSIPESTFKIPLAYKKVRWEDIWKNMIRRVPSARLHDRI